MSSNEAPSAPDAAPLDHVRLVLVQPRSSGNVGAAARAAANHGLSELVLVDPPAFDPEVARWMAPGAEFMVDGLSVVATVREAVADRQLVVGTSARRRRWDWPRWEPSQLVEATLDAPRPTAILFGREDTGLSNDELSWCHAVLELPTTDTSSLNLAQAVVLTCGALFWEARTRGLARKRKPRTGPKPSKERASTDVPVPAGLQRALVENAVDLLDQVGYFTDRSKDQVEATLYRLAERTALNQREAAMLKGMLSDVTWRLNHPDRG